MNYRETNYCKEIAVFTGGDGGVLPGTNESDSYSMIDFIYNDKCIESNLNFSPTSVNI